MLGVRSAMVGSQIGLSNPPSSTSMSSTLRGAAAAAASDKQQAKKRMKRGLEGAAFKGCRTPCSTS